VRRLYKSFGVNRLSGVCCCTFRYLFYPKKEAACSWQILVSRSTFTWIQQKNQNQPQQYIRQHLNPPIYYFLLPFTPILFFPTVRYTTVYVQPQQEVTQSGTSIHNQAPAFYWITPSQKKNDFTLETGNASHSFKCAFRITCMLTASSVSYNRDFFLAKSKIHSMWTWMKIIKMHRGDYSVFWQCLRKWP
jgi:hypothetical protein